MCARRSALCFALAVATALASPCARGAERSASGGVALQTFEEGRKLYVAGQFAPALRSFEASFSVQPSPNTRLYIARCLRGLGKVASASAAFRLAGREAEDRVAATGEQRYVATGKSAALEADQLAARVPRVTLALQGDAPEAAVLAVDGAPLPRVTWGKPLELDPGEHVVELTGPQLAPFRAAITVAEGEAREVKVVARRVAAGRITLRFHARPLGMAATLDGEPVDISSREPSSVVGVGRHRVEVSAPGYAPFVWRGDVADGAASDVAIELRAAPPRADTAASGTPRWLFFSTAGLALVTAGAGGALFAHAAGRDSDEQAKPIAERGDATRENIRAEATVASGLLVGGGVAAVGAVVLAFTTRWGGASRERAPATVSVVPRGLGVGIEGRF
ncbi:MAG: hypothetical protein IPF92_10725 [Myxococcales bacterium]|nr:hypothetical protein [Myxococcales bacterium]MBL0198448.1 hypothetical protein [Myxococcales bacterium]HQY60701.1 hypothetical protein [Polyangiaceae bacterium]